MSRDLEVRSFSFSSSEKMVMMPAFAGVKLYLSFPLTRSFLTLGAWMSVKVSRRGGRRSGFKPLSRPMLI